MKNALIWTYIFSVIAYAGVVGAQGSAVPTQASKEASVVQVQVPASAPVLEQAQTQVFPQPLMVKDEILVPPNWLQDMIITIKKLPVIGPVLTVALQWLGVIATILTALVAFLLVSIRALTTVLTSLKLVELAEKIVTFQNSKIVYWLKYISMFNAQKPVEEKKANDGTAA